MPFWVRICTQSGMSNRAATEPSQARSSRRLRRRLSVRPPHDWRLGGRDETDEGRRGDGADGGGASCPVAPPPWERRPNRRVPAAASAPATSPPRLPRPRRCRRRRRRRRAVETTACGSSRDHRRGGHGDDRTSAGRDGAPADAAGERQRARRRGNDRHQPAAAGQPAAGRTAAPAGRLAGRELEPQSIPTATRATSPTCCSR